MCPEQRALTVTTNNKFQFEYEVLTTIIIKLFIALKIDQNKQGLKKKKLFNKRRQCNISIFDKIIFCKYRTRQIKTTETIT